MRSFYLLPTLQFSTLSICLVLCPIVSNPVLAQITPDGTLGSEGTIVTPNQTVKDLPADLIEGGATRGSSLFHSFLEFNVNEGQRVYFENPTGIDRILSRVPGSDISDILGTLGVNGGADLFFLNPQGIIFGSNARLDIRGSFTVSTGSAFTFSDGSEFRAVDPNAPPLLTVNLIPGVRYGAVTEATLINNGQLQVGRDLTLGASRLELGGGSLQTGRDLVLQGTQRLLVGGSYTVGGYLFTQDLAGNTIDFVVPHRNVIWGTGDVQFTENYSGESLYVLAGGAVSAGDGVSSLQITGGGSETISATLQNGQAITVSSDNKKRLDIRSGLDWTALLGSSPVNSSLGVNFNAATTGDIHLAAVDIDTSSSSSVGVSGEGDQLAESTGGDVRLMALENIDVKSINTSASVEIQGTVPRETVATVTGQAMPGDIDLEAGGNINTGSLYASGSSTVVITSETTTDGDTVMGGNAAGITEIVIAQGGNIALDAGESLTITGDLNASAVTNASASSVAELIGGMIDATVTGGAIALDADESITITGNLNASAVVYANAFADGELIGGTVDVTVTGGAIVLDADESITITGNLNASALASALAFTNASASSVAEFRGGMIDATVTGGAIGLDADESISITGDLNASASTGAYAPAALDVFADIEFRGGTVDATVTGGAIGLDAGESITITGNLSSSAFTDAFAIAQFRGGTVDVTVTGGAIDLDADESITITGDLNASAFSNAATTVIANGSLFSSMDVFANAELTGGTADVTVIGGAIVLDAGESISITGNLNASADTNANANTYAYAFYSVDAFANTEVTGGTADVTVTGGAIGLDASESISITGDLNAWAVTNANTSASAYTSAFYSVDANATAELTGGTVDATVTGGAIGLDAGESITITGDLNVSGDANASADAKANAYVNAELTGGKVEGTVTGGAIGLDAGESITITSDLNSSASADALPDSAFADGELIGSTVDVTVMGGAIALDANTLSLVNVATGGGAIGITSKALNLENTVFNTTSQSGSSGTITIDATDFILIDQSQFMTGVNPGSNGNGGDILWTAPEITLSNFSILDSATFGTGKAGNVSLIAESITLQDSNIFSITNGEGNAGTVSLKGEQSVSVLGQSSITTASALGATGLGGEIRLDTETLTIEGFVASTDSTNPDGLLETEISNAVALTDFSTGDNQNVGFSTAIPFISLTQQYLNPSESKTYAIDVNAAGTRIFLDLDNTLGSSLQIILLDTQNNILASNTNSPFVEALEGQGSPQGNFSDPYLPFTFQESGTYLIQIQNYPGSVQPSTFDLQISLSDSLFVEGGLSAQTNSAGNAGNITLTADTVNLGNSAAISTETTGAGAAGNITLTANQLTLAENSQLSATVKEGATTQAAGGDITLNVSNLDIAGKLGIFSETQSEAPAGNLRIQPKGTDPNLIIQFTKNGFISASTQASGNGGSITLNAPESIDVSGLGQISVETTAGGDAGAINLNAPTINLRDGVTLSGSTSGSGEGGTINLQARDLLSLDNATIKALTTIGSTGNGGDIFIDPITTTLKDSRITLDSQGTGTGGDLELVSDFLDLDRSEISASTVGSDGGSLSLTVPELLTLQNGSIISTQAGTTGAGGNGGNITINSNLIVGSENSDIIANAFEGNGGNITIATEGLFGFTVENTDTPRTNLTSDITASSQFGVSSTPNISQALDPSQSLAVLNTNIADLSSQIDRRCDLVGTPNASRFVITGKGGLPPNDRNRLSLTPLWTDLDLSLDATDPGQRFYAEGNYAEAIDTWETQLQSPELPLDQQVTLHANLAQAYATQGDWDRATEAIDRGLNRLNHHSNPNDDVSNPNDDVSNPNDDISNPNDDVLNLNDDALNPNDDVLNLNDDVLNLNDDALTPNDGLLNRLRARLLTTQSHLLTERGQLNQAFSLSEEAHRLYQEQNDRFGILQTQLNQAQILTRQGNLRQANDRLAAAQNSLEPAENDSLTAAIDLELGTVQRLLGDYDAAQTALERSQALWEQTNAVHRAAVLLALGDNDRDQFVPLNRQFNNLQEQIALVPAGSRGDIQTRAAEISAIQRISSNQALTHYRQVQATAITADLRLQALTQEFLMTIDLAASLPTPNWSAVETLAQQIEEQLTQLPPSSTRLYTRLNLVDGLLKLQENTAVTLENLTELLTQTLEEAQTLGDRRAETQALGKLGILHEQQQQWNTAQQFTVAALNLAQADGQIDLAYRLSWQLGRLQYAQGNTEAAIVAYNDAIQTLNTLRSDLNSASAEVRFSFRDAIDPIYRELVSLLLSQDTPATPRPENITQARDLIESLQLSELVNFFQTDCDVSNLAQIDELDPHSAVIYPIILSDRLEVIVSLPGQPLKHYATDLPESTLAKSVSIIQQLLATPSSLTGYLPVAQRLYDAIIRPAEADLNASEIKNLVFVMDGSLRNIPMSALHDGEQFLIEKYAIALTPGLQLFKPQPLQQQELKVLLGGLTEARQGFSALPNVQAEIASIGSTIPSNVLLDDMFVEANLLMEIGSTPFPVVHLATHGEFGSTAEDTFILTWDDRFTASEFSQLLQSRSGGEPIELLILSACRTAAGDDRAALGLAGIAVRSGARSTLASLWYINDEATSVLMGKLYESLSQQNTTKAEAVRQAQLELLRNPQYANPYYWAPFVLVGNWL